MPAETAVRRESSNSTMFRFVQTSPPHRPQTLWKVTRLNRPSIAWKTSQRQDDVWYGTVVLPVAVVVLEYCVRFRSILRENSWDADQSATRRFPVTDQKLGCRVRSLRKEWLIFLLRLGGLGENAEQQISVLCHLLFRLERCHSQSTDCEKNTSFGSVSRPATPSIGTVVALCCGSNSTEVVLYTIIYCAKSYQS